MGRDISGKSRWSLTLFRSGGYTKNSELKDALFSFGRTKDEVLENPYRLRLPYGISHILSRFDISDDALESGFIIDFSTKEIFDNISGRWCRFEKIISSSERPNRHCRPRESSVYSTENGSECFEMIEVSPESNKLPNKVWIQVRPLDDLVLAWVISQNNILLSDDKEQKTLHDFCELNIIQIYEKYIRLPGPPDSNYNFFNS